MTKPLKFKLLLLAVLFTAFNSSYAADIRIALRSHQDTGKSLKQWQPTADYLSKKIPEHRFIMVPFVNISAMNQAISSGEYHFSLANPSSAIEYIRKYGAQPISTLVNKRQGKGYSEFGSVIFTRADRNDINSLKDLKGKSFVAVDEQAFGGWRVGWLELLKNKINPFTDFKVLRFAGGKQQDVVYNVLFDKADAGTVRTDMLERMAANNEIKLSEFKILGEKKSPTFPFMHSTDLYPEWLFSTARTIDAELKDKVTNALLSIKVSDESAMQGNYVKWIRPLDYAPVDNLLQELKVGPYNIATMGAYTRFISQYGMIAAVTLIVIATLFFAFLYLLNLNRQILSAKDALNNEVNLRHTLERQLVHSQRMESLGQLTGGIAHDFNNMLASINGFTELALTDPKVKDDEKLTGYLNQVLTAGDKSAALVNQMLMFGRSAGDNNKKEKMSVYSLVNDTYYLFESTVPANITLDIKNIDKELYISANATMMTQVIMNMYLNAKDAIANNEGVISIGTRVVDYNANEVLCDSCRQDVIGSYVCFYIHDTGCGIDTDMKEHLFDPFYSTKEVGKGTGMGLSVVHGIVHKHNGHILVESIVGKGTTLSILLPMVSSQAEDMTTTEHSIQYQSQQTDKSDKRIMVIDDEVSLTIYLTDILQQNGYEITSFNNSQQALEYLQAHHNEFDLVISDQSMPNMTGTAMAEKMMTCCKELPVIIYSGYNDTIKDTEKDAINIRAYLDKPIKSEKLLEMINSIIKPIKE